MKKLIILPLVAMLIHATPTFSEPQCDPHWETETSEKGTLVRYYGADQTLLYTEKTKKKLNIDRKAVRKRLDRKLAVSVSKQHIETAMK